MNPKPTPQQLAAFARTIAETTEYEFDCDEALDHLAAYVEEAHDRDIEALPASLRAVAQHLRVCPECLEEFRTLLQAISAQSDSSGSSAT